LKKEKCAFMLGKLPCIYLLCYCRWFFLSLISLHHSKIIFTPLFLIFCASLYPIQEYNIILSVEGLNSYLFILSIGAIVCLWRCFNFLDQSPCTYKNTLHTSQLTSDVGTCVYYYELWWYHCKQNYVFGPISSITLDD